MDNEFFSSLAEKTLKDQLGTTLSCRAADAVIKQLTPELASELSERQNEWIKEEFIENLAKVYLYGDSVKEEPALEKPKKEPVPESVPEKKVSYESELPWQGVFE